MFVCHAISGSLAVHSAGCDHLVLLFWAEKALMPLISGTSLPWMASQVFVDKETWFAFDYWGKANF